MEQTFHCKIGGMTCGNCALTISRYLEKQGVGHIHANPASGELQFTAGQDVDVARIYKGIGQLGYQVIQPGADAHEHGHTHQHKGLGRMLLFCALFTAPLLLHMFAGHNSILNRPWLQLILCLPVYAIGVAHFGRSAIRALRNGIPNMDVLIIMGASAAFFYSLAGMLFYSGEAHQYLFFETTATIITFVLVGNWLEERTVQTTTSSIQSLAALQPSAARVVMTDSIGKETIMTVESKLLKLGDVVLVNDGDSIPSDGIVLSGIATVNESMLSGESLPVQKEPGMTVIGGAILLSGNMRVKTTAVGETTALAGIIRLVQQAQAAKPPMQKLADKISAVFVPLVLGIAVLAFLVNFFAANLPLAQSMMRSIAVLVIACPCAMGLATPAAIAVGLGRAARKGILVKGGDTLERFKDIKQIVFDKTGTLTTGALRINTFKAEGIDESLFRSVIVSLEHYSAHPIARSILEEWKNVPFMDLQEVQEHKGEGIQGMDKDGNLWQLGSHQLLKMLPGKAKEYDVHLLRNGAWVGGLSLSDELRADAAATIRQLHADGFTTVLLSGDREEKAIALGRSLGIDRIFAGQSPAQKMARLDDLRASGPLAMVGDGINDAPALANATVGISLSDATKVAMQSASVILSNNRLSSLPAAIRLGRYTYQTIKQNLFWAFCYNILAIPLAAAGYLSPIWAAIVMAFSDVILVLNSLRLNYRKID
ncbi:heavy metal translocating P-type ATPase [Taibaiella koreensis]|uniref:heavy metal translocating P-type ATPase n=1 Tax=Taibaiella koreensis TaxID=1268548 RepID=UPI000E59E0DD|nr:cation-translocating P-type ATPase [Taibaiella koreensis]